ncbi:hypothetical protein GJJ64_03440 [Pedobacter sp. HX-22-1]|uniref:Uncharacterized protein n=1 Tax=Pedobacter puniceum TaxID=2666136 RepID=A0A7K0FJU8_9SPHI|nr:hypothetical protein [Pedobacter puniceum]MRX46234.1 hypothetical protein [Pedobacter puniceum]
MKANHNNRKESHFYCVVVVNISSSKNESKSQPFTPVEPFPSGCCKYQ